MATAKKQLISSRIATWLFLNRTEQLISTKEVVANIELHLSDLQQKLADSDLHPFQFKKTFREKEITEKTKTLWIEFLHQLELGYFTKPPSHEDEFEIRKNVFLNEQ